MDINNIKEGIAKLIKEESISQKVGKHALQTLKAGDTDGAIMIINYALRIR
jgi:hypothetical protein